MKNRTYTTFGRPLAASSIPGEHGKPQLAKTPSEWTTSLAALVVLALLGPASAHAAGPRYQLINLGSLGGTNYYETMSGLTGPIPQQQHDCRGRDGYLCDRSFCFNPSRILLRGL